MSKYTPYIQRSAGDTVTSGDWNRLQEMIREEIRQHRHQGQSADSDVLGPMGARLDHQAIVADAVTERVLADDAVTGEAMAHGVLGDVAVSAEAAISERDHLIFAPESGHNHDGVSSSLLAARSVGTEQLAAGAVTEDKLDLALMDEIRALERLLTVPQAIAMSAGAGGALVDIAGHGFGTTPGAVRLLKVLPGSPGEYRDAGLIEVVQWTDNRIRVRLPDDPTGLIQVEVGGLPLLPIKFAEALVITRSSPEAQILDAAENILITLEFSTELLIDPATAEAAGGPTVMVLRPGASAPEPFVHQPRTEPPFAAQPVEVYYGEDARRMDGTFLVSRDRKSLTFIPTAQQFPWAVPVVVKVYAAEDRPNKPVLLAENSGAPMAGAAAELRFSIRKRPPEAPKSLRIRAIRGRDQALVSPENMISAANQQAVPVEIDLHAGALPSEWIVLEIRDSTKTVSERIPAIPDADGKVYASLDCRDLSDGQVRVLAQARNTTSGSAWTTVTTVNAQTRETVDWVPKDTRPPYIRVHPVRTPTALTSQRLLIEVEPGSTVTVAGGARDVVVTDTAYRGQVEVEVPLRTDTSNSLRVSAVDPAVNSTLGVVTDRAGTPLVIVQDSTIPQLFIEPVTTPTSARQITIRGRASEQVSVAVTAGGQIYTGTSNAQTPFAITIPLQPNVQNQITINATDTAGLSSIPVLLRIDHDDTPPTLSLINNGYHGFSNGASSTPHITVRRTRVALRGYTEPGATVIMTGHGHRVTTTAGGDGTFTLSLPFRLMPSNIHNRREVRTFHFDLDAVDRSGNHTNQRKQVTVTLDYEIPGYMYYGWWWWGGYYYYRYYVEYYTYCYHVGWWFWRRHICETRWRIHYYYVDFHGWLNDL